MQTGDKCGRVRGINCKAVLDGCNLLLVKGQSIFAFLELLFDVHIYIYRYNQYIISSNKTLWSNNQVGSC